MSPIRVTSLFHAYQCAATSMSPVGVTFSAAVIINRKINVDGARALVALAGVDHCATAVVFVA